jgi:hypothetical protein
LEHQRESLKTRNKYWSEYFKRKLKTLTR